MDILPDLATKCQEQLLWLSVSILLFWQTNAGLGRDDPGHERGPSRLRMVPSARSVRSTFATAVLKVLEYGLAASRRAVH